jgi:sulfide:quinone oxidoreductase
MARFRADGAAPARAYRPRMTPLRTLIAGGGVAGLETLIGLRALAGDRVSITVLDPEREFVYRPRSVGEPFAHRAAERRSLDAIASEFGARHVVDSLARVQPDDHLAVTTSGEELEYDALVVALGGRRRPALRRAITFRGPEDSEAVHGLIQDVEEGYSRRIAFVVPGGVTWPLPLYELALMTAARAAETGAAVELSFVTPEATPLALFGPIAGEEVAELLTAAGIDFRPSTYADVDASGVLWLRPEGREMRVDRIVALPVIDGPAVPGLPSDERGFIPVDAYGRVRDVEDVYAAGDGTQFPVKQGGIAAQQADIVAGDIARRVGVKLALHPGRPVLRAKLLTGGTDRFMRHEATGGRGASSEISNQALWWPPSKIAGAYLAPYLGGQDLEPPAERELREIELPVDGALELASLGARPH